MTFQYTLYNKEGSIVWITLNRPHALNALNSELWRELYQALDMAENDESLRVVIVTGAGRAFSAGDDIKEVASFQSPSEIRDFLLNCATPVVTKILDLSKPIIAAVNGPAYGGGCEIAMLCDIVVASENATFAVPEARIGAYPPIASTIGVYLIGKLKTSMLALTGESITAPEAERIGLVSKVVSPEKLNDAAKEIAEKIMLSPPTSIKAIKKKLNKPFRREELEEAVLQLISLLEGEDAKEGHQAFIEKRPPKWVRKSQQ